MPFGNPILGGTTLVRPAIKSPDYQPSVSGWSINQDGSAEFDNVIIRGIVQQLLRIITGNVGAQALGVRDNLDTADRFTIRTDGQIEWGDGSNPTDTDLYRSAAGVLSTDGVLDAVQLLGQAASTASTVIAAQKIGDAANRLAILADGTMEFGTGGTAPDTFFGRAGAQALYAGGIKALISGTTIETWHNLAFTPVLWANRGAGFPPFSYRMVASPYLGLQITGQMQPNGGATADGTVLATLPTLYRPVTAHLIDMRTGPGTRGILQVGVNGSLTIFDCAGNTLMQIIDNVIPLDQ